MELLYRIKLLHCSQVKLKTSLSEGLECCEETCMSGFGPGMSPGTQTSLSLGWVDLHDQTWCDEDVWRLNSRANALFRVASRLWTLYYYLNVYYIPPIFFVFLNLRICSCWHVRDMKNIKYMYYDCWRGFETRVVSSLLRWVSIIIGSVVDFWHKYCGKRV